MIVNLEVIKHLYQPGVEDHLLYTDEEIKIIKTKVHSLCGLEIREDNWERVYLLLKAKKKLSIIERGIKVEDRVDKIE